MILELLTGGLASDLIERTASTPAVTRALQASLAPAFLLVGIGSIMNVMVQRLNWVAGRIERLEDEIEDKSTEPRRREIEWLFKRRRLARHAVMMASAAAVTISLVVALLFVSTYIEAQIGTAIAVLWVATVCCLIASLGLFLRETSTAARGSESFRRGA